ncbi:MAG: hypothetical protein J7L69_08430 [Desulfobulbaceae bacterium]|nr:hypothetical protein [Desulfobulbaceae bacterium]
MRNKFDELAKTIFQRRGAKGAKAFIMKYQTVNLASCNFSISGGIPTASPFEKGGLRGFVYRFPPLIEKLLRLLR